MKKRNIYLAALCLLLVLSASMESSLAYFTTNAAAQGGYSLELGKTTIHEDPVVDWTKRITVTNTSGEAALPVYIRIKAFAGSKYTLLYSDSEGKWSPGAEGYYYYRDIVGGGESTDVLNIKIEGVPRSEEITEAESFNVAVIYESTPVLYDAAGVPYADWNVKLNSGNVEGGAE
ncbi:hypothetical protein [Hominifimenecus sp. rT4P-3]|uniref:hypothetical protein n=1 Tax=Hominifimenecus sp. rT4P-3 TaxID=3242979 RepID=UPI003DA34499